VREEIGMGEYRMTEERAETNCRKKITAVDLLLQIAARKTRLQI